METSSKVIVIGGSWGGIQASVTILKALPANYSIPIVLVLHRLRNHDGNLQDVFKHKIALKAVEVEEKEMLQPGHVYLAPSNYHVLLEKDHTFSLDDSELENYSRPSIDVTFTSAADVFAHNTIGILLSGASKDGSSGLKYIFEKQGKTIAQDPNEAEIKIMPLAAIESIPGCTVMNLEQIQAFLLSLHDH
ncbi:chemotaxis protein CheB [Pontibacter sp. BT310]|uniref:protein-glutamate methylesterase n=1 Tax=Pontibacter populi TaxID=890055 RepID=A0ABS6X6D2_9BACT|nr:MULTISPECIES: chemotaxis protein CheB [Pontibacter]MBJ6116698.1 chemotaxis protein CheB [Pontibacter sp. BT310]MBR0569122.1 chemotaxis protein CheB [Microvirga sp. STS03]MBW3363552.1 chemotaxis protein CheB [Pontibacter populi]